MLSFRSFSPFVLALSIVLPLISHAFITKTAYWPEFLEEGGGSSQCVDTSSSCADYAFNYITHNSVKPSGEKLRLIKKYPAYTFDQLSTHFADHPPMGFNKTFKQRYWVEDQYYKPGGPVFFLDGGETTGMDRLVYLETGIVKYLAEATNGLGIIFEHRYYGRSHVAKDLSTESLQLLTTAEALADNAYFSSNFPYSAHRGLDSSILSNSTPWIIYGGSYAGAKSAFSRYLYPDQIWGAIASSGVVTAIENFWEYTEPIRKHAAPTCVEAIKNVVAALDDAIFRAGTNELGQYKKSVEVITLMKLFGLEELSNVQDWMTTIAYMHSAWQDRNWDMSLEGTSDWDWFCSNLTAGAEKEEAYQFHSPRLVGGQEILSNLQDTGKGGDIIDQQVKNFGSFIKREFVDPCTSHGLDVETCFGSENMKWYNDTSLNQGLRRPWLYQVCTEWGYFQAETPPGYPALYSRTHNLAYASKFCNRAYGFDGDRDPWLYATTHSPISPLKSRGEHLKYGDGILIQEGYHHVDENGLGDVRLEPERIRKVHEREVEVVRGWVKEWEESKKKN
ncbi:MAG: hypothetical protein MMC33_010807 [Icmadophila ericetorum]|nr:hypothetical protein [Icmadophila ericetorum]